MWLPKVATLMTVCGFALAVGCADQRSDAPSGPGPIAPAISDARHSGGNPRFFFLPPMVPDPAASGTFDPSLSPVVTICLWQNGTCAPGAVMYTMADGPGSETVRLDVGNQQYIVNWHTDTDGIVPGQVYRISVGANGIDLGFADVQVVGSGQDLRNVSTGEYVPLKDGRTLPIKFRIETGIFPLRLVRVAGDGQTGPMTSTLVDQVVARVEDAGGFPLEGMTVVFHPDNGGEVMPSTATSDHMGLVETQWSLGPEEGPQLLTVTLVGSDAGATAELLAFSSQATDPDLVVHYPFESIDFGPDTIGALADRSAFGNHGVRYGISPTTGHAGGVAASFDGLWDSLRVPSAATSSRTAGTIAFWLKLSVLNKQMNIFAKKDQPTPTQSTPYPCAMPGTPVAGYTLRSQFNSTGLGNPADSWYFFVNRTDANLVAPVSLTYGFDQWQYFTYVWSPAGKVIYLNGAQVAATVSAAITPATGDLIFSPQSCPRNEMLDGAIDEIRIYKTDLSQAEIAELFAKGHR